MQNDCHKYNGVDINKALRVGFDVLWCQCHSWFLGGLIKIRLIPKSPDSHPSFKCIEFQLFLYPSGTKPNNV